MQPKTKQNKIVHFYFVIFVHLIIDIYNMQERIHAVSEYLYENRGNICIYKEPNEILNIFDNPSNDIESYRNFIISLRGYIQ